MRPRLGQILLLTALLMSMSPALTVRAAAPTGACCLRDLSCEDITESACMEREGRFIAVSSCSSVECVAHAEAPVISVLGLIGVAGALGGLGIYRILRRRS